MSMKGKYKILSALIVSALMLGVTSAQPSDYSRVDDSGTNVGNTAITHVPNDGGSVYLPENTSEATFEVQIDPDDSHQFDSTTTVNVTATLSDNSDNTYQLSDKQVNPVSTDGTTNVSEFTVEWTVQADSLNSTLNLDEDMDFESTTEYVDSATSNTVTVNERTWFEVTEDSIAYTISLILGLVPVFIVFLVLQELKGKRRN